MESLVKRLKKHEALSLEVYPDRGKWAIGYGHQCAEDHSPITIEQANEYLTSDIHKASDQYMRWKGDGQLKLSKTRDEVLVEMIFWHGWRGFLKFKKMIAAIKINDYEKAADEMIDSDSGRRYFTRMYELATLMRQG